MKPLLLTTETVREFSERLKISERQTERLLSAGLPHLRIGHRTLRIVTCSADEWLIQKFGKK